MTDDYLTIEKIEELTYNAPSWSELIDVSEVICITGMKRHGKSAFVYWIAEQLAMEYHKPIYAWGIPHDKQLVFPDYMQHFSSLLRTKGFTNAIIAFDEIHRSFSARRSLSEDNVDFSDIMTFSGQNNQILLLATLNNGLIDINTFRICNPILVYKRVGYLQANSERQAIKQFTLEAAREWKKIPGGRKDTDERNLENKLSYIISDSYIGWMRNEITDWWSQQASEMHASTNGKYNKWLKKMISQGILKSSNELHLREVNKEHPYRDFEA